MPRVRPPQSRGDPVQGCGAGRRRDSAGRSSRSGSENDECRRVANVMLIKLLLAIFLPPLAILGMVIAVMENPCLRHLARCIKL